MTSSISVRLSSLAATRRVGNALGTVLQAPLLVALEGDLGAGKTTFVRAVAEGFGLATREVTSPTYALCIRHQGPRGMLAHLDLYRMGDVDDLESIGWRELLDGIALIEWASRVPEIRGDLDVTLSLVAHGPRSRTLTAVAHTGRGATLLEAWQAVMPVPRPAAG